jgi:predicted solute-binding protein
VVKKLGVLEDQTNLDHMTFQHYLDNYKLPLSEQSMEAILSLTEVAVEKGKKKSNKLKKDKTA